MSALKDELRQALLETTNEQLDDLVKPYVQKWATPPKAIEILEVLDRCVFGALANGLIISTLQIFYDMRLKEEGRTHAELVPLATWRNELTSKGPV